MKRRIVTLALSLLPLSATAAGLGVNEYGFVDGVRLDPKTGAITLLLVIDRPLEDGLTKPKVRSKMLAYHQWVATGLVKRLPDAKPELGVRLLILHPEAKNALGASVLEQLMGYAKELRFQPVAQALAKRQ